MGYFLTIANAVDDALYDIYNHVEKSLDDAMDIVKGLNE